MCTVAELPPRDAVRFDAHAARHAPAVHHHRNSVLTGLDIRHREVLAIIRVRMIVLAVRLGVGVRRLLRLRLHQPVHAHLRRRPALRIPHPSRHDARARERTDPELRVHRLLRVPLVRIHNQRPGVDRRGVDLEVQVVVGGAARVADERDYVARLDALAHQDEELRVVVIRREQKQPPDLPVVADRDGVGPLLRRPGEDDHAVADRMNGRSVRVVELDALVLLEIAPNGRAVAVRLIDVRLVGERDGPSEPRVSGAAGVRVGPLLVGNAHERESLIDAAGPEAGGSPGGVDPRRQQPQRADAPRQLADVERVAVLGVHALARAGERLSRARAHERLHRRQIHAAAFYHGSDRAGRIPLFVEPGTARGIEPVQPALGPDPHGAPGIRGECPHAVDALGAGRRAPHRRGVFRPGAPAVGRTGEPPQVSRPQTAVGTTGERQHVLAAQPAPEMRRRECAGRVADLRPGGAVVPGQLDAVGGAHVHRVAPCDDAVRRDVLPLGAELLELPAGPGLAAVRRQAPPVPHRAVPDLPVRPESEGVHEIEGNRPCGRVARMLQLKHSSDSTARTISFDFVNAFGFGPNGEIWYGTVGNGWGLSTDGGKTWTSWELKQLGPEWQYVAPNGIVTRGDTVYVGTADGIKLSWDHGTTWSEISDSAGALTAPHLWGRLRSQYVLALARGADGSLWTGHLRGLARSTDGGRTWTEYPAPVRCPPPGAECVNRVRALAPDTGSAVWVGTERGLDRLDPARGSLFGKPWHRALPVGPLGKG